MTVFFFSGFGERLLTEVKKLAPKDVKIKVGPGSMSRELIYNLPFKAQQSIIVSINVIYNQFQTEIQTVCLSIYCKRGKKCLWKHLERSHTICVFSPFFNSKNYIDL